jgi:hypothetical protein
MRKTYLLGLSFGGALALGITGASAAPANPQPAGHGIALAKLAAAQDTEAGLGGSAPGAQNGLPEPAHPKSRRKRRFFGLPLLAAAAFAGGGAVALDNDESPDSP